MRFWRKFCVFLLFFALSGAVFPTKRPITIRQWVHVEKHVETGTASYYGDKSDGFLGKITASGRILTKNLLIAAHPNLPFGTILRVTNLENGLSVVVEVADRGPFVHGRVLDLSAAAAESIDLKLGRVRIARLERELVETQRW